jgi:putative transposase
VVEVTVQRLKEFKERTLSEIVPFAIFIDTLHRGGEAFLVTLGLDPEGYKHVLGFWEGATENHEVCEELFADLERRGLGLSKKVLWVTQWRERDPEGAQRPVWEEADPPAVYNS